MISGIWPSSTEVPREKFSMSNLHTLKIKKINSKRLRKGTFKLCNRNSSSKYYYHCCFQLHMRTGMWPFLLLLLLPRLRRMRMKTRKESRPKPCAYPECHSGSPNPENDHSIRYHGKPCTHKHMTEGVDGGDNPEICHQAPQNTLYCIFMPFSDKKWGAGRLFLAPWGGKSRCTSSPPLPQSCMPVQKVCKKIFFTFMVALAV